MNRYFRIIGCMLLLSFAVLTGVYWFKAKSGVLSELGNPAALEQSLSELPQFRRVALPIWQKWLSLTKRTYFSDSDIFMDEFGQFKKGCVALPADFAFRKTTELKEYCDANGRNFLYVILPGKPYSDDELRKYGISCEYNTSADLMAERLAEKRIPCFDARTLFTEENFYSYFFRTDRHWTPDAGLLAARALLGEMNRRFGYSFDTETLDGDRFSREVIPSKWIGELGEKTLGRYSQKDDFILLSPSFSVRLRTQNMLKASDSECKEGGFDVLLDKNRLEESSAGYSGAGAYYYYSSLPGVMKIENMDVDAGNILFIKDSFSSVMLPYLSLAVGHITTWDMRDENAIYEYLDDHQEIETVVIAYTLCFLGAKRMNDFQ